MNRDRRAPLCASPRLIDTLTDRFFVLAGFPYIGRARDDNFGSGGTR